MGGDYEEPIGTVAEYRPDVDAAKVKLETGDLHVGDTIHIRGDDTELEERLDAMQLPDGPADIAHPGDEVGLKVDLPVEEGATVFRVEDPYGGEEATLLDTMFAEG